MRSLLYVFATLSLLHSGAIFGFFYAWICSTMWGLDTAEPQIAIAAMQAMNASVRNAVFAPAFFGTPLILFGTAVLAWTQLHRFAAAVFFCGALIYLGGGLILTMTINVPMNDALAVIEIPANTSDATQIWRSYSGTWQFWNVLRTLASGVTLALVGLGIYHLQPKS